MLAGSTTPNALKQGLAVGLAASFILIGLQTSQTTRWLEFAALTVVSMVSLSIVGGAGFLVDFGTSLVAPDVANAVASVTSLAQAGEMATMVWLLVARSRPTRAETPKIIALAT